MPKIRALLVLAAGAALIACQGKPSGPLAEPAANGCWVKVYAKANLSQNAPFDVINGPGEFGKLRNLPGARYARWDERIEAIVVGPHARVYLWCETNFQDDMLEFGPGRSVDLSDYDFDGEPNSMKIEQVP